MHFKYKRQDYDACHKQYSSSTLRWLSISVCFCSIRIRPLFMAIQTAPLQTLRNSRETTILGLCCTSVLGAIHPWREHSQAFIFKREPSPKPERSLPFAPVSSEQVSEDFAAAHPIPSHLQPVVIRSCHGGGARAAQPAAQAQTLQCAVGTTGLSRRHVLGPGLQHVANSTRTSACKPTKRVPTHDTNVHSASPSQGPNY